MILIRFPGNEREALAQAVETLVTEHAEELPESFTVLQPGQAPHHPALLIRAATLDAPTALPVALPSAAIRRAGR